MKTAMQELKDYMQSHLMIDILWKYRLEELLEKEKKQIIDAYAIGMDFSSDEDLKEAEQYYNQTYNNEKLDNNS